MELDFFFAYPGAIDGSPAVVVGYIFHVGGGCHPVPLLLAFPWVFSSPPGIDVSGPERLGTELFLKILISGLRLSRV